MAKRSARSANSQTNMRAFKRNRNRGRSAKITAVIVILAALAYIIQAAYFFFSKPKIVTELVNIGSVDLPYTISGIIIRDESVYTAERDGQVVFEVGEYERVKAGTAVASIQNTEKVEDINESREDVEAQIMELQSMREDISSVNPAVQLINKQLKNMIDSRLYNFTTLNVAEVYALRDNVVQSLNTRNKMILDENRFVKEELGLRRQQLLTQLSEYALTVRSNQTGLVSTVVDGMEADLNLESMMSLTREQTHFSVDYNQIIPKKDVAAGDPIFKIVASNDWFIGAYIPNELIDGYEEGDKRVVYLEDKNGEYQETMLTVEYLSRNYNETYVLFRNTKNIIDYLGARNINLRTLDSVRTGYKVSNTAITSRDFYTVPNAYVQEYRNGRGSYILTQGEEGLTETPVIVTDQDADYAYIPVESAAGLAPGAEIFAPRALAPELTVLGLSLPGLALPETPQPEAPQPEAPLPVTTAPDAALPETPQPEAPLPATTTPDAALPETTQPEAPLSVTTAPDAALPETPQPEAPQPVPSIYILPNAVTRPGVYKINNGYAEFQRITLAEDAWGAAADRGYSILDPDLNPGLRTYDYIVTTAGDVSEGQIIK